MADLPTNFKSGDILTFAVVNDAFSAVNINADAVVTVAADVNTTKNGLTATQAVASKAQSDLVTANQTIATQAAAITTLQNEITAAKARLDVLETVAPPPAVPGKPTGLTAGTITTTSVVLSWTAPVGGAAPTSYQTRRAIANSGNWVNGPSVTAPTATGTVTGLTQGTSYDFDVVPVNAAGPGVVSDTITRTTLAGFTPSPGGTAIPPASSIIMSDGAVMTVVGGVVMRDTGAGPVAVGQSSNVILGYLNNATPGVFYQESNDPALAGLPGGVGWWYMDLTLANPWVFSSDPRPVTPGSLTPRTRLITYLNNISGNHVLSGQVSHADSSEFDADTSALGFDVAISVYDPFLVQWANNYLFDISFQTRALAHAAAGGIVGLELNLPNPAGNGSSQDGNTPSPTQILANGTAQHNALIAFLDQSTPPIQALKDAGRGVLFRIMWELDGSWFWWGNANLGGFGKFTPAQQVQLYRMIHDYYVITKGFDHLVWQWSINAGPGSWSDTASSYPGDAYVDVVGIDAYTNTLASTYTTAYNNLRSLAPSKPISLAEWGAGDPGANNPSFNVQTLVNDIKNSLPRICFMNAWSGWGWSLDTNPIGGLTDPYVINRAQVVLPP